MIKINRLIPFFIFSVIVVLLIGCSNKTIEVESPKELIIKNPIIVKNGNQEFKIIPFYSQILDYLESVSEIEQHEKMEEYYYQKVVEPFQLDTLGKGKGYWLKDNWAFATPKNIKTLEEFVYSLINNQDEINKIIEQALIKSSNTLPGENKTVYLFPPNPDDMYGINLMGGTAGLAVSKDVIIIQIDPSSFNLDLLEYTVAHEYHHTVYMESGEVNSYNTLLDSIILEGKADTFAKSLYHDINIPWIEPLSNQKEEEVWEHLKENLMSQDRTIKGDYFGNPNKGIPHWTNYKIGYQIVNSFLEKNPTTPVRDWTVLSAEEILSNSKYGDRISK
ncbi:hypothetical protein DZB84_18095 [Bacillus sp. HNG]|uniref:DUF2268 domain-containing protein n=1 Tax=Bacillus sp. HNG TaxID=2293325 RepID=UPI000E2F32AD|nr:DUF2268 domain-containing putative Zn-dependent protease [Bacillus sp. HNG]RFB12671.1 hypothetical protein DZB84_18095 [Bacillus sp. HNG]